MRIEICSWIIVLGVSFIAQDLFWKRFAMWYRIFWKIIYIYLYNTYMISKDMDINHISFFYAFICVGSIRIQSIDWSRNKFGLSPKKHCPRVCLSLCLWLEGQGLFVSQRCHNACFKLKRAKFLNIYNIIPPEPWNHVVHLVALKLQVQLPCRSAIPLKLG